MVFLLDLLKTSREPYLLLRGLAMKDHEMTAVMTVVMTVLRGMADVLGLNEVDQDLSQPDEAAASNARQVLLASTVMYLEVGLIAVVTPYENEAETAIVVPEMNVMIQRESDQDLETEAVDVKEAETGTVIETVIETVIGREVARVITIGEILDVIEVAVGTVIVRDEEVEAGTRTEIVSVGEAVAGTAEGSRGDDSLGCDDILNVKYNMFDLDTKHNKHPIFLGNRDSYRCDCKF